VAAGGSAATDGGWRGHLGWRRREAGRGRDGECGGARRRGEAYPPPAGGGAARFGGGEIFVFLSFRKIFAECRPKHTAKSLLCARQKAYGKGALCRRLYAVSPLLCVTHGKEFAVCILPFAVCTMHTANK